MIMLCLGDFLHFQSAFQETADLKVVFLSTSLTSINYATFSGCKKLTAIAIPT